MHAKRRSSVTALIRLGSVLLGLLLVLPLLPQRASGAGAVTVVVQVMLCSQNVSQIQSLDAALALCPEAGAGAGVKLGRMNDGNPEAPVGIQREANTGGVVTFDLNFIGTYVLESLKDKQGFGGTWIACSGKDRFGAVTMGLTKATGESMTLAATQEGQVFECHMLLFDPNAPGPEEPKEQFITVLSMACSSDLSNTIDVNALTAACPSAAPGVPVTITDQDGNPQSLTTDNNGAAVYKVPTGALSLSVTLPEPFDSGWKVCTQFNEVGQVGAPEIHPVDSDSAAPVTVSEPGIAVQCFLFLYSRQELTPGFSGRVFLCDTNLEGITFAQLDAINPSDICALVSALTSITLTDVVAGTSSTITTGGDGSFAFATGDSGSFQIVADASAPYNNAVGLCEFLSTRGDVVSTDAPQAQAGGGVPAVLRPEAPAGRCDIYLYDIDQDKPGETTTPPDVTTVSVSVAPRLCPDGFTSTNFDQLDATCTAPSSAVTFTITGATTSSAPADGEISADFTNLAPGDWTLTEETPTGFGQPLVFCALAKAGSDEIPTSIQRAVSGGNSVSFTLATGDSERCTWFNTTEPVIDDTSGDGQGGGQAGPLESDSPLGTLVIVLHTCPDDFDPNARDADPEVECDDPTDDVNISATDEDNKRKRRQTGEIDPGVAIFTNLESGTYRLHQGHPDGVESGFIWKCDSDEREVQQLFIPLARIDATGSIKIVIEAPETLTCDWYNLPAPANEPVSSDSDKNPLTDDEDSGEDGPGNSPLTDDDVPDDNGAESTSTISVEVRSCAATPNPLACGAAGAGVAVTLSNTGTGEVVEVFTDGTGLAVGQLPAGAYTIDSGGSVCLVQSDAALPDGSVEIADGEAIEVTLFVCE